MQRYFLKNSQFEGTNVRILEDDAHHIIRVMRMNVNDEIIVCNEDKGCFYLKITELKDKEVIGEIISQIEKDTELPANVTIAQGLPKGDKYELVLQKATECGAFQFIPVKMERSVVKLDAKKETKKLERWTKIVKEAAEQSHRQMIPNVHSVINFRNLIEMKSKFDICLFAYEETAKVGELGQLKKSLKEISPGSSILVLVGPEGGISENEEASLLQAGFAPCALGPRILRTETAPIYLLSAISYELEL